MTNENDAQERFARVESIFSERVNSRLGRRGTAQLARATGLDLQRLYRILRRGQSPALWQVWAIADGLGVDPSELLPFEDNARLSGEPMQTPAEARLLEAVRSKNGREVVAALGQLLPERELAYVTAATMPDDKRDYLLDVLNRLADGLGSLATDVRVEIGRQSVEGPPAGALRDDDS